MPVTMQCHFHKNRKVLFFVASFFPFMLLGKLLGLECICFLQMMLIITNLITVNSFN